jgi:hypothetical protein
VAFCCLYLSDDKLSEYVNVLWKEAIEYAQIGMYVSIWSKRSRNNLFCDHATSRDALTFLLIIPYRSYLSVRSIGSGRH